MAKRSKAAASFTVAFGDVKLSRAQATALSRAVQTAALSELARLDLAKDVRVRYPREWLGIWLQKGIGSGPMPVEPPVGQLFR